MRSFTTYLVVFMLPACSTFGQNRQAVDDQSAFSRATGAGAPASQVSSARPSGSSVAQWEYWTNLTIPANSALNIDSQLDYSTTDTVRVTLRSTGSNLGYVSAAAYWASPHVPYYGVADVVSGRTFAYSNAGGVIFSTYGTQLRLQLINSSSSPITLSQIVVFMRQQ